MSRKYEINQFGSLWFVRVTEIIGCSLTVEQFKVSESNPVEALKVVVEYLDREDCDD